MKSNLTYLPLVMGFLVGIIAGFDIANWRQAGNEKAEWETTYANFTSNELDDAKLDLLEKLSRDINNVGTKLLDSPRTNGGEVQFTSVSPDVDIFHVNKITGEGAVLHGVYLRKEEYPSLYARKRKINWINSESYKRK